LVTDCPPEIVCHPFDLHIDFIQVLLPVAMGSHRLDALAPELGGEHLFHQYRTVSC
jgi:hypothetical protein